MLAASYIIAASQLFALAFGAPLLQRDARSARSLVERAAYKVFGGDGTPAQGWPQESDWKSFEDLWTANEKTMMASCAQFSQENNSQEETDNIKKAIQQVATESNIKAEFILAVMIQESKGCVRAPTTNYGHDNPGLMQSFEGTFSCNPAGTGTVPCPADTITGMIKEGAGIGREFGVQQALDQSKATDVSKYYKAARIYNSGSIAASGNLGDGIATHCYASDIANRLIGWAGESTSCEEGTIGSVQGSASSGNGDGNVEAQDPPTTTPPTSETPAPSQAPSQGGNSTPSGPKAEGAAANCTQWYTVKAGDNCGSTGIPLDKLRELNTGLMADCSNLWAGSAYCIAA